MSISVTQEEAKWQPVTLTLTTKEEVDFLFAMIFNCVQHASPQSMADSSNNLTAYQCAEGLEKFSTVARELEKML